MLAGSSSNPASADDFHGYWVNEYDSLGEDDYGACDNDDLNWNDDFALAFRDEVDTWSGWTHNIWGNSSVRAERFVDYYIFPAWAHDHDNYSIDGADVGYFTGHGSHRCDEASGYYWSWMHLGNTSHECTPDSDDSDGDGADWYYEDNLKVLIIDACRNMQKCVWQNGGYAQAHDPDTDMFAGYHGSAFDDED
jgi:hypothetical protein